MNSNIINIADRISRNEDISMDDFNFLKGYIFKANKGKKGNDDDVLSIFVLDVRMNYNSELSEKEKEAWIYGHIKRAITKEAKFDIGTLYNPAPVSTYGDEREGGYTPYEQYEIDEENKFINNIHNILHGEFEKAIFDNCIRDNIPVAHIAKEYGKSPERGRIVKDRISQRIKEYIENKPK